MTLGQICLAKHAHTVIPRSHENANWIALLPVPQNASTITSQRLLSAMCSDIFSGVALNHPSRKQMENISQNYYNKAPIISSRCFKNT